MSIESSAVTRRYFPHVNLLRAFAALSVVVYHLIEHYAWEGFPAGYGLIWFRIGWMSVDLFFVISGFVIGWSLIQLHARQSHFLPLAREFLIRRAGRIMPLYLLTMVAYAIFSGPHLLNLSTWPHWLTHLFFIHPLLPQTFGSINGVNWSVGIEVHFYLFALLTSPFWVKRKPLTLLIIGILLAWSLRAIGWHYAQLHEFSNQHLFQLMVQMPMMLDEFAVGVALALLIHHYPPERWPGSLRQQGVALMVGFLLTLTLSLQLYWQDSGYWHNPALVIFWRTSLALAFALLVAFCIWLPAFKKPPLLYRAAYYLGDISYGIYLWHLPVILWWKPYLLDQPELYLLVTLPCIIVLSAASWHLLEKPMIRFSKGWSKKTI